MTTTPSATPGARIPEPRSREAPPPKASPPAAQPPRTDAGPVPSAEVLDEIRDLLRTLVRDRQHEDFSLTRLLGTVVQVAALVLAAWGFFLAIERGTAAAAGLQFLMAIFCQMLALTLFVLHRTR